MEDPNIEVEPTQDGSCDHKNLNGHFFTKKSLHKPSYCHHCTEVFWGIWTQGYTCEGVKVCFVWFWLETKFDERSPASTSKPFRMSLDDFERSALEQCIAALTRVLL